VRRRRRGRELHSGSSPGFDAGAYSRAKPCSGTCADTGSRTCADTRACPAPTPAPAPAPAPTPPPPPPPTQGNASLLALTNSESFTNDNATGAARFYTDNRNPTDLTAGSGALTVTYDAAARSYTVAAAGRTQVFTPANIDTAQSSAALQVYGKASGALTESLSLTTPGTSGRLTYEYVGGGFWQRATNNGATVDARYDAFTYGIETPDTALPRTGAGVYAVDLLGVLTRGELFSLGGTGTLQVDFLNGQVSTSGQMQWTRTSDGRNFGTLNFTGNGQLSTSANAFAGSFGIDGVGRLNGGMAGRFYGPAAQEVGAAWNAVGTDGDVAVGTIIGRRDPNAPGASLTLLDLRTSQSFNVSTASISYNRGTDGKVGPNGSTGPDAPQVNSGNTTFDYDAATGGYTYRLGSNATSTFVPADKVAAASDARVTVYEKPGQNGGVQRLVLYNPGAENTELALTYVSFGRYQTTGAAQFNGSIGTGETLFPWGIRTSAGAMPRTGTGRYEGLVFGTATGRAVGTAIYALSGTSVFDVDFGQSSFTGSLNIQGRDAAGAARDFGSFNFALGRISGNPVLAADVQQQNNRVGSFEGAFYGPNAAELGGRFFFITPASGSDPGIAAAGVTLAKRKP
jgi:hypothetical protein